MTMASHGRVPPVSGWIGEVFGSTPGPDGAWARNSTACWNVGRFCQSMFGWPTIPTAVKVMESNWGMACLACAVCVSCVHWLTLPLPFAAASFVSLLGAVFSVARLEVLREVALGTAICAGVTGVGGLVYGSGLLVWETRMALRILSEETQFML